MSFRRGGPSSLHTFGNPDLKPDFTPSERYPKTIIPVQADVQTHERQAVSQFLKLQKDIRDGPLYTGSSTKKGRVVVEIDQNVNDGIKRYTDKYIKKRKIGRSIDEHPYIVSFFPAELHSSMGVTNSKLKKLDITKFTSDLLQLENVKDTEEDKSSLLALKFGGVEEDEKEEQKESDIEEEDEEDDFEEDEDDDYNAEKYFDDGDDADGDEDDDGEAAY
jgi:DNA-directed RNA polymerase III subunit RPC7